MPLLFSFAILSNRSTRLDRRSALNLLGPDSDPLAYGLFHEHPELRDGHLHFGDKPGFGLEPDLQFVERYRT